MTTPLARNDAGDYSGLRALHVVHDALSSTCRPPSKRSPTS